MHNEQEILNAFVDDLDLGLGDTKKNASHKSTNADKNYKSKWPIYEIKGTHGTTYDVCETLEGAQLIAKHAKLKRHEIWQINQNGQKVLVERSHNEAGFVTNAFSVLKGLKHVA